MGFIRDFLLDKGSDILGKKTKSWATKAGGIGFLLLAAIGFLGQVYPDVGLPVMTWDEIAGAFSLGLTGLGIGRKMEKAREENRILTQKVLDSHEKLHEAISQTQQIVSGCSPATEGESLASGTEQKPWNGVNQNAFGPQSK